MIHVVQSKNWPTGSLFGQIAELHRQGEGKKACLQKNQFNHIKPHCHIMGWISASICSLVFLYRVCAVLGRWAATQPSHRSVETQYRERVTSFKLSELSDAGHMKSAVGASHALSENYTAPKQDKHY